jgi:hypothetical protein
MTLLAAAVEIENSSTQIPESDEDETDIDSDPEAAYDRLRAIWAEEKKPRRKKSGRIASSGEGSTKRPTQNESSGGQERPRVPPVTTDAIHKARTPLEPQPNGEFAPDKNLRSRVKEGKRPDYRD